MSSAMFAILQLLLAALLPASALALARANLPQRRPRPESVAVDPIPHTIHWKQVAGNTVESAVEDFYHKLWKDRRVGTVEKFLKAASVELGDPADADADEVDEDALSSGNTTSLCSDFDAQGTSFAEVNELMADIVNVTGNVLTEVMNITTSINGSINNFLSEALEAASTLHEGLETAAKAAEKLGNAEFVVDLAENTLELVQEVNKTGYSFAKKMQTTVSRILIKAETVVVNLVQNCESAVENVFAGSGNMTIWPESHQPGEDLLQRKWWPKIFRNYAPKGGGALNWALKSAGHCESYIEKFQDVIGDMKNASAELLDDVADIILKYFDYFAGKAKDAIEKDQEEDENEDDDDSSKKKSSGWGGIAGKMKDAAYAAAIKGITAAVDQANSTIHSMVDDAAEDLTDLVVEQVDDVLEELGVAPGLAKTLLCQAQAALDLGSQIHGATDPYYVVLCSLPSYGGSLMATICPPEGEELSNGGCLVSGPLKERSCADGKFLIARTSTGELVQSNIAYSLLSSSPQAKPLANDSETIVVGGMNDTVVGTLQLPEETPLTGTLVVVISAEKNAEGVVTWNVTSVDGCKAAETQLSMKPKVCA